MMSSSLRAKHSIWPKFFGTQKTFFVQKWGKKLQSYITAVTLNVRHRLKQQILASSIIKSTRKRFFNFENVCCNVNVVTLRRRQQKSIRIRSSKNKKKFLQKFSITSAFSVFMRTSVIVLINTITSKFNCKQTINTYCLLRTIGESGS